MRKVDATSVQETVDGGGFHYNFAVASDGDKQYDYNVTGDVRNNMCANYGHRLTWTAELCTKDTYYVETARRKKKWYSHLKNQQTNLKLNGRNNNLDLSYPKLARHSEWSKYEQLKPFSELIRTES